MRKAVKNSRISSWWVVGQNPIGVPLNYIINRDGKIVDTWYGNFQGHARAKAALRKTGGELAEALHGDVNTDGKGRPLGEIDVIRIQ